MTQIKKKCARVISVIILLSLISTLLAFAPQSDVAVSSVIEESDLYEEEEIETKTYMVENEVVEKIDETEEIVEEIVYDTYISQEYVNYAIEIADNYDNVDAALIIAMIEHESSGQADVVSSCNAIGLMQIRAKYQKERMQTFGVVDLYNAYDNILIGTDMISELIDKYGLNVGLVAYNTGEYSDSTAAAINGKITGYSKNIIARAEELRE